MIPTEFVYDYNGRRAKVNEVKQQINDSHQVIDLLHQKTNELIKEERSEKEKEEIDDSKN
jgi:hypothetical protein